MAPGLVGVHRIAPADIHLTLLPPWNETSISAAIAKLRGVADTRAPSLWPSSIWDTAHNQGGRACCGWDCAASDELSALHTALLAAFRRGIERPFRPHVTIARIRGNGAAIARKQPIDRALAFWQRVETVKLIQSPPSGEVGYCVLAAFKLGKPAASVTTG